MHKKDFFRLNRMVILKQRNSCFGQDCACMTPVFVRYWARRGGIGSMDKIYLTTEDNLTISFARLREGAEVVLAPGIYRAKVLITTPGITVTGAGADKTKILWDDYAKNWTARAENTTHSEPGPLRYARIM